MTCPPNTLKVPGGQRLVSKEYSLLVNGTQINADMNDWLQVGIDKISPGGRGKVVFVGLQVHLELNVGVGGPLPGEMLWDVFGQINVNDADGVRHNLTSGLSWMHFLQEEDPTWIPPDDVASGAQSVDFFYPIPGFRGQGWAESGAKDGEWSWDLISLRNGQWTFDINEHIGSTAATFGADVTAATFYFVAYIREEQQLPTQPDGKTPVPMGWRSILEEYQITASAVSAALPEKSIIETVLFYVGRVGERLGTQFLDTSKKFTSVTLGIPKPMVGNILINLGLQGRRPTQIGSQTLADWTQGVVIPIWTNFPCTPIDQPVTGTVDYQTTENFNSGGFQQSNQVTTLVRRIGNKKPQVEGVKCEPDGTKFKMLNGSVKDMSIAFPPTNPARDTYAFKVPAYVPVPEGK